jgi:hypothetical protein
MSVRKSAFVLAVAALALPAAFAQATSVWVGGERGWVDQPIQSTRTRDQVSKEFLAFQANPVDANGGRYVGGQLGYVYPQHILAFQNGELVCVDKIAHNPKPEAIKSAAERRTFLQQYPA